MKAAYTFAFAMVACSSCLQSCQQGNPSGTATPADDYWVLVADSLTDQYGYRNQAGQTVIPLGKYSLCYTDTFRTYAIVTMPNRGLVAIDRNEAVLYQVFPFDNGPDYPADGLFRMQQHNRIGYADSATGRIVIAPQFSCAWPFEHGTARVSRECTTVPDGEHFAWASNQWFHINKQGQRVPAPAQ